jgi:topoisomerase-4 subunit A
VIRIVRTEDEPKPVLVKRFSLSNEQAEAILETKLRHLAKLEEMKIRGEQAELAGERDEITGILGSAAKLKALIRAELLADADKYGDKRRTRIVEREAAKAIDEAELVATEPVTVVLSTVGFVRQAKGHEIDPRALSYKTGDSFQAAARGKSTQQAVFLDSTGRTYSLPAHALPSARGQGEPLSGRVDPPDGATFASVMLGEPGDRYVIASDAGYGFIAKLEELYARNKAGKSVLSLPKNARSLPAARVLEETGALIAVAAASDGAEGRLLVFPVADLPELAKGKGNKLFNVPSKRAEAREELVVGVAIVAPRGKLRVLCGERAMTLSYAELSDYRGERAQRGALLPKTYRRVTGLEVELPE